MFNFPWWIPSISSWMSGIILVGLLTAIAEFPQARTLAQQAYKQTHKAIARRLPLLENGVRKLKKKVNSVESESQQLNDIRDRFHNEIKNTRDRKAKNIANSFREDDFVKVHG
jgi:hypothetical protein